MRCARSRLQICKRGLDCVTPLRRRCTELIFSIPVAFAGKSCIEFHHPTRHGGAHEHQQALAILEDLAEGVDPATGSHRRPRTGPRRASRAAGRGNAGKPWSKEEADKLVAGFDAGQTVEALAAAHGGTRFAIEARLARFELPMPTGLRIAGLRAAERTAAYAARARA